MPRKRVPERQRRRTYALLAQCVRQRRCLCTPAGLPRPCTHSTGRPCPVTQANPARIGCEPGPFRPGPRPGRALPLLNLPRQGFRPPTPTAPARRAGRPHVDAHTKRNRTRR